MLKDVHAYRFGEFTLDAGERRLLRGACEVPLRPKTFETLLFLLERHGHLVRRDALLERVWPGTSVSDAVLTHCIAEARQALHDDARRPRYVKTISLAGYKFVGNVSLVASAVPDETSNPGAAGLPWRAVAVLPFANLSGDPANEYFCDGLAEELINGLTKVRAVRVVAHSSSFSFKGRDVDARAIGRELGVGTILEGSVRKSGDRLRIAAQLIDATNGYHLWSEQYDRRLKDVFGVQDEIARAILSRIEADLGNVDAPLVRSATRNMEAYELYLRGRAFWHRRFHGCLHRAMTCFERALECDPAFAMPYTGLADAYAALGIWGFASPADVFPRAVTLADRALALEPTLAEAHASRGLLSMFHDWDWGHAGRSLARAVELNPGNALIRLWNGHYFSIVGDWEAAFAEVLEAQEHDPLSPVVVANVGWTFSLARQQERAIEELEKVLARDPANGIGQLYMGYACAELGRHPEALEAFSIAVEATGGMPWAHAFGGWVHGLAGDARRARAVISDLHERAQASYVPPSAFALVYLGLAEDDRVFEWLRRCVAERDALMPWMKFMPAFDRLRDDPRFEELLQQIGLRAVQADASL